MVQAPSTHRLLRGTRTVSWLVAMAVLAVLAGVIVATTLFFRQSLRHQIVNRDGMALYEVALMHARALEEDLEDLGSMRDQGNRSYVLLLTSRLRGVVATRLFDPEGRFQETFPENVLEATLDGAAMPALRRLRPACRFYADMPLADLFYPAPGEPLRPGPGRPILEINIPLHAPGERELLGVGQFWIQGESIAAEYRTLDANLWMLAGSAFFTGGLLLAGVMILAFRRLRRAQDLLAERTRHLWRANQELALAAKTSAVGSVASHLIHGLKNPLSGLRQLMQSLSTADGALPAEDQQQAVEATRRMQSLINEVMGLLRHQEGGDQFAVALEDLLAMVQRRIEPIAREAQVRYRAEGMVRAQLGNRQAGLISLILVNLLQNGVQATPAGGEVRLRLAREGEQVACVVEDEGGGLPESVQTALFAPCHSSREGGSGIGLAISKQLANHLGAALELRQSGSHGCIFALVLPASLFWTQSTVAGPVRVG